MHKVYLLLRNNKQNGPYSLDELVQLGLKPYDLVWVEGKSAGWRYPGEIDALKPYVTTPPQQVAKDVQYEAPAPRPQNSTNLHNEGPAPSRPAGRHIFVSLPGKGQERAQKSEFRPQEDRQELQRNNIEHTSAATGGDTTGSLTPEPKPRYAKTLQEMEEEYTNWVYKTKTRKKHSLAQRQVLAVLAMGLLIVCFYFGATRIMASRSVEESTVETARPVTGVSQASENNMASTAVPMQAETHDVAVGPTDTVRSGAATLPVKETSLHTADKVKVHPTPTTKNQPPAKAAESQSFQDKPKAELPPQQAPVVAEKPTPRPMADQSQTQKPQEGTVEKKRGGLFSGLFSKLRHKKDEPVGQQAEAVTPEKRSQEAGGERKSVHRGDEPAAEKNAQEKPAAPALAEKLEVTSNERSEDWMMGVNGLKLTVHNRNDVAIKKATVEVLYYDENNHLLNRRSVNFNNIPARGNLTVQAPEERLADHVDYKVTSVSGL